MHSPESEDRAQLLDRLLSKIARQRCLGVEEAEDFASWAKVKLLEEKSDVFEKFEGRSSLVTFLTAVMHNLFRDYRVAKWGRFRVSAAARRMGLVAERLEILLFKDGRGFDEAVEILRRNHGVRMTTTELAEIAARLPERSVSRRSGDDAALATLEGAAQSDDRVRRLEAVATAARVERALDAALGSLTAEERLVLKLRLYDGTSVADIARLLRLDQKQLYRRIERLTSHLRQQLAKSGVCQQDVDEIIDRNDIELRVASLDPELTKNGPSNKRGGR
jgi:RNA polymerase sigma factor (sigma-70 family)